MTYVPGYNSLPYTSQCDFNKAMKNAAGCDSDYSTRLFMQRNAKKLIDTERLLFIKKSNLMNPHNCSKCSKNNFPSKL